ncbi:MAG: cupredoxin family copper-binding protein [Ancalomicrobiaceae bacterium]|nr:cupredoxin family copper-binding protein [Ancalomicrobiaceae bacterium]
MPPIQSDSALTRRAALLAALMPPLFIHIPAAAEDAAPNVTVIRIENFSFTPAGLTVPPGTTVTWQNNDDIPHTVVSPQKVFRSKPLDTGDRFSFTFAEPGVYSYFCGLHPHMVGTVTVAR